MLNFNEIHEKVKQSSSEPVIVNIDIGSSLTMSIEALLKGLDNFESMSDEASYDLVNATYGMVLESTVGKKNKDLAITVFSNQKYVSTLIRVMENVKLKPIQRIYCNKLVYDYIRAPINKDPVIVELLQNLSMVINNDIIPSLLGAGVPNKLAMNIAVARFSSVDEQNTVKRVNSFIFNTSNTELITEFRLIKIYETLYHDCVAKLFKGLMFDIYSKEKLDSSTSESNEIYSLMDLAVLTMVNTMPSDSIKFILKSYYTEYSLSVNRKRFSLRLSSDYDRINAIIYELEAEGIYLP